MNGGNGDGFTCLRCGECCRGEGRVRLNNGEIEAIGRGLGMDVREAVERFTRLAEDRSGLALKDDAEGNCVFLDADGHCRIEHAKPRQCREYPAGWRNPGDEQGCPGARQRGRGQQHHAADAAPTERGRAIRRGQNEQGQSDERT